MTRNRSSDRGKKDPLIEEFVRFLEVETECVGANDLLLSKGFRRISRILRLRVEKMHGRRFS